MISIWSENATGRDYEHEEPHYDEPRIEHCATCGWIADYQAHEPHCGR
jgi:hypothetical protein